VVAPGPPPDAPGSLVITVNLNENEDVVWIWSTLPDNRRVVTGYRIIKTLPGPDDSVDA
jgi:hypothetical protein